MFKYLLITLIALSGNLFALPPIKDVLTTEDHSVAIDALLDGLHQDAHEGNFQTYFARYSPDAVFLEVLVLLTPPRLRVKERFKAM